jgi:hypothetical protein
VKIINVQLASIVQTVKSLLAGFQIEFGAI